MPVHRVYASDQAHSSIEKAMIVLGLGEENVVRVPSDAAFRLDVAALRAGDRRRTSHAGFRPMAVVATVGTTSTASVDPVREIAAVCREHGVWLHVDAAYGGALALLPEGRVGDGRRGAARTRSSSIRTSGCSCRSTSASLFMRRAGAAARACSRSRRSTCAATPARGVPSTTWTTAFSSAGAFARSRRGWCSARSAATASPRIREHCRLAQQWARWVEADDRFVLAAPVEMAVVCFRFAPAGVDDVLCDRLNERIVGP